MGPVSHHPPKDPSTDRWLSVAAGTRFTVEHVAETGSTNADLASGAAAVPDGSVLVADHQTAGRGRLDRRWDAPLGANLLFSVLLRPTWDSARHPLVTASLAVAVVDALGTHGVRAAVKWPNDVLLVGGTAPGKVAGILAELVSGGPAGATGSVTIVVGMGLNVGWPTVSDDAPPGATSLAAAGHAIDRADLLESILARFDARLTNLEAPDGLELLRSAHLDRSATIGLEVRVDMPDGPITGTAVGLALDGSLLVDAGDGTVSLRAGDVVHLRPV